MMEAHWHTFQVLTKRSERLRDLLSSTLRFAADAEHIWWGVSVENRKHGLPRIEHLRDAPARVRFLSVEPLLEHLGQVSFADIDWVIVGGESGHGARPMQKDWVVSILEQCQNANVPFFFKQWGGVRKKATGRELNGRTYDELPPDATRVRVTPSYPAIAAVIAEIHATLPVPIARDLSSATVAHD
jgi:protein gp37